MGFCWFLNFPRILGWSFIQMFTCLILLLLALFTRISAIPSSAYWDFYSSFFMVFIFLLFNFTLPFFTVILPLLLLFSFMTFLLIISSFFHLFPSTCSYWSFLLILLFPFDGLRMSRWSRLFVFFFPSILEGIGGHRSLRIPFDSIRIICLNPRTYSPNWLVAHSRCCRVAVISSCIPAFFFHLKLASTLAYHSKTLFFFEQGP